MTCSWMEGWLAFTFNFLKLDCLFSFVFFISKFGPMSGAYSFGISRILTLISLNVLVQNSRLLVNEHFDIYY